MAACQTCGGACRALQIASAALLVKPAGAAALQAERAPPACFQDEPEKTSKNPWGLLENTEIIILECGEAAGLAANLLGGKSVTVF